MKISIMSRRALEKLSERGLPRGTAVISITDFGERQVEMASEPDFLLRLAFDDVDSDVFNGADQKDVSAIEEKYHVMTEGQAREIADFFADVSGVAQTLICQCEHGQSRSAAVAAAILEHRSRRGIGIFADDRYFPNKLVFRRTLSALRKTERGESPR